jgi:hypothetical protein
MGVPHRITRDSPDCGGRLRAGLWGAWSPVISRRAAQDVEHSVRHGHDNSDSGVSIVEARQPYVNHFWPPLRRLNLQTVSVVVYVVTLPNSTASPSTRTQKRPPSVAISFMYAFGEGVVVVGGAVVVGVAPPAVGGLVVVGVLVLGWAGSLDVVSAWRDDPAASSVSVRVLLVSTCWVVVVTATAVVVLDCLGISDSAVGTSVEVVADSRAEASSPSISRASRSVSIARIAAIPTAVGTFVTTLPTAAAAMVTATMVATNQAIPTPAGFLTLVVWYTFSDSAMHLGNSSIRMVSFIRIEESHRWPWWISGSRMLVPVLRTGRGSEHRTRTHKSVSVLAVLERKPFCERLSASLLPAVSHWLPA